MLLSPSTLPSPRNPGSVVASSALVVSLVICSKKPALTSLFRAPLPSAFCCPSDCSYPCHLLESCVPFSHLYNDLFSQLLPARDRAMTAPCPAAFNGILPRVLRGGHRPCQQRQARHEGPWWTSLLHFLHSAWPSQDVFSFSFSLKTGKLECPEARVLWAGFSG